MSVRRIALFILIFAACLLVIGGGSRANLQPGRQVTSPSQRATPPDGWPVKSQSVSPETAVRSHLKLKAIDVKIVADDFLDVVLSNDYDKDITAVAAAGDKTIFEREYLIAEAEARQKLASGASDTFYYTKPPNPDERIKILAVVFSDGTSEGDQSSIQRILDERRGMKMQLSRVLPYFQLVEKELQNSGNDQLLGKTFEFGVPLRFATLKKVAESLPIETDDGTTLSKGLESGLTFGKQYILRKYVWQLQQALANERVDTWYDRSGQKQTIRYSPQEHFRMTFAEIHKSFNAFLSRL